MGQITRFPLDADAKPLELSAMVILDTNAPTFKLKRRPTGPDGSPIPVKAFMPIDENGDLIVIGSGGSGPPPPTLSSVGFSGSTVSLNEGNAGTSLFQFNVTRTGDLTGACTVNYSVAGSGAFPAEAADFFGAAYPVGVVSFGAGEAAKTVDVLVLGDATVENDQGFSVTLSTPINCIIGNASINGLIINDDSGGGGYAAPTAPVLTRTSASGGNPMSWNQSLTSVIIDVDKLLMRYRVNSGAWIDEVPVDITSDFIMDYDIDGNNFPWPLFEAATFADNALVEVQVGIRRPGYADVYSTILSDTMLPPTSSFLDFVASTPLPGVSAQGGYSTTNFSYTNISFGDGYGILHVHVGDNRTILTLSVGGVACTRMYQVITGNDREEIWRTTVPITAGNKTVSGTTDLAHNGIFVSCGTLTGTPNTTPLTSGGPAWGYRSGGTTYSSGSLTVPTDGVAIGFLTFSATAACTINGGTEIGNLLGGTVRFRVCKRQNTGVLSYAQSSGEFSTMVWIVFGE